HRRNRRVRPLLYLNRHLVAEQIGTSIQPDRYLTDDRLGPVQRRCCRLRRPSPASIKYAIVSCVLLLRTFPSSQRRGGCGINRKSRSHRSAADGVVGSARLFRLQNFAELTTPSAPFGTRLFFDGAATPPLQGGETPPLQGGETPPLQGGETPPLQGGEYAHI